MPLGLRISTWAAHQTPRSRFKLAVSLGFVIVASGSLMLGVGQSGFADSLFGAMPDFFGASIWGQHQTQVAVAPSQSARRTLYHRATRGSRHAANRPVAVRLPNKAGAPLPLGRQSMCVRLCDGFAFPVGAYHGGEDNASHEATCRSECPGARTALYVTPAGSDVLSTAADVRTGASYSDLPDAFHYTSVLSDACSCHAKSGGRIASLLRDFTLRRGDAVMTRHGFQVFHGGSSFPYKRKDFVALSKSPDIRDSSRAAFRAIERASLSGTTTVADGQERPNRSERQASR